jgi:hypothetical protein
MDDLLHGVDVPSLQQAGLGDPQAGGVDQGEEHAVLGSREPVQEALDLRTAQDRRQVRLGLGNGDPGHLVRLAQGPGVEELQGCVVLPEPGSSHRLAAEMVHPTADGFLAGICQLLAQEFLEPSDRGNIVLDGAGGAIRHPEVAGEPGQGYTDCHCSSP